MKIAVVGSRTFNDYSRIKAVLDGFNISTIVSGGAKGADSLGERYANEKGLDKLIFLPDWDTHGKAAGFIRNTDIIENADMVVACWDGESRGTKDSMTKAHRLRKDLLILYF
jgi:hypothetical protein